MVFGNIEKKMVDKAEQKMQPLLRTIEILTSEIKELNKNITALNKTLKEKNP